MKKLFKKSIACLIAVLMVISTMPFTAVTASAATELESFQAATANYYGSFEADTDYKTEENYAQIYKNVLYSPSNMPATKTLNDLPAEGKDKIYLHAYMYYGNTVLLYDGNTIPSMGIGFAVTGQSKPWNYNYNNVRVYRCNITGNSQGISFRDTKWHGSDGRMNYTYIMFGQSEVIGTTDEVERKQGEKGYYGNVLQYTGGDFTDSYKAIQLSFDFVVGTNEGTKQTHSFSTITESTIYVLNYKKLVDKVNEARTYYSNLDKTLYTQSSLDNLVTAINNLQKFNPSSYTYATNTGESVKKAAGDMDALITAYQTAKNNLKFKSYTVTFVRSDLNDPLAPPQTVKTVEVEPGSTVSASEIPELTSPAYYKNNQHYVYYWSANGSEFTSSTTVNSDIQVTELRKPENCSGGEATCSALAVCDVCKSTYGSLADHSWGDWTSISDTQHKRVCANDAFHVETEVHNIVNGACTECGYVALDMVAYNNAVAEYNALKKDPEYATKYTSTSITEYESLVDAEIAKESTFATQEEVDAAAAAILSAKTKLVYAKADVKVYIAREGEDPELVDTISKNYGETADINVADKLLAGEQILKWVIETQDTKVNTKLATTDTTVSMVVTEPADVYVHIATEKSTEAVQYSKVSFISKNGAVSFVKYVPAGTTLYTNTVDGVEIPFYEFKNWNKASVTADGNDIEVKAVYEFIGEETNKCNVHYNGTTKTYTYDSFVYLFGAEGFKLALATDEAGINIITYLNENAFYAPHTENVYVIKVPELGASIGITGSYMQTSGDTKIAAFNCKFYVPDGCQVVEYGMTATSSKGSMKIKAEKASDRGEYCIKVSAKVVPSITGVAYLTYKDAKQNLHTIYSNEVIQTL